MVCCMSQTRHNKKNVSYFVVTICWTIAANQQQDLPRHAFLAASPLWTLILGCIRCPSLCQCSYMPLRWINWMMTLKWVVSCLPISICLEDKSWQRERLTHFVDICRRPVRDPDQTRFAAPSPLLFWRTINQPLFVTLACQKWIMKQELNTLFTMLSIHILMRKHL